MAEKKTETAALERTYTIPLRAAFRNAPRIRKTNRAVKAVHAFLVRHMKSEDVKLGQHLNEFLWGRGIRNPPPRVTVTAVKDAEGVVRAELAGKAFKESVKPIAKEEAPETLKDKLTSTLGSKKDDEKAEKPAKPKKAAEEAKPEIPAEQEAAPAPPVHSKPAAPTNTQVQDGEKKGKPEKQ